jgi:PAS domain-containing protein
VRTSPIETQTGESLSGVQREISDGSERSQAAVRLRQSEETLARQLSEIESIYATAPVRLCVIDLDFRYVRINERLAKINGLPVAQHLGRGIRELLPTGAFVQLAITERDQRLIALQERWDGLRKGSKDCGRRDLSAENQARGPLA